jgi:hypothetical protein
MSSATRLGKWREWRVINAVLAATLLGAASTVAAAPASAADVKYIQADCLVPSMVGNPCAVYSMAPHFKQTNVKARALPQVVVDSIVGCVQNGLYSFVENWEDVSGPIPPNYKKLLSGGYLLIGCVEGIAEANMQLK